MRGRRVTGTEAAGEMRWLSLPEHAFAAAATISKGVKEPHDALQSGEAAWLRLCEQEVRQGGVQWRGL